MDTKDLDANLSAMLALEFALLGDSESAAVVLLDLNPDDRAAVALVTLEMLSRALVSGLGSQANAVEMLRTSRRVALQEWATR